MKKILLLFLSVLFLSCSNQDQPTDEPANEQSYLDFTTQNILGEWELYNLIPPPWYDEPTPFEEGMHYKFYENGTVELTGNHFGSSAGLYNYEVLEDNPDWPLHPENIFVRIYDSENPNGFYYLCYLHGSKLTLSMGYMDGHGLELRKSKIIN